MRSVWSRSSIAVASAVVLLAGLGGCLESETPLAPVEQAVMDKRLVGEWTAGGGGGGGEEGEAAHYLVRNFNGREYYVEVREQGRETARYSAHLTAVGGASFLNLRELSDDGTLAEKYVILRVDRAGDAAVNLRALSSDFFDDKPHATGEDLRAAIAQNLDKPEMYDADPLVLTRKAEAQDADE